MALTTTNKFLFFFKYVFLFNFIKLAKCNATKISMQDNEVDKCPPLLR